MDSRVHIPFCEDIEAKIVEYARNPDMPTQACWGWYTAHAMEMFGVERVAWTICPICRSSSGILSRHTITVDGEVNASILCPGRCNGQWHVWGILDGYTEHGGKPQTKPLKE